MPPRILLAPCLAGALILCALGVLVNTARSAPRLFAADGPDLVLTKVGPAAVLPGSHVTYTLRVTNTGTQAAGDVQIVDTPGYGIRLVTASPAPTGTGASWVWALGDVPAGGAVEVTVGAVISPSLAAGTMVTNTALVTDAVGADSSSSDNLASSAAQVVRANLVLAQSVPAKAAVGGRLSYRWTLTNAGTASAAGVYLTTSFGAGMVMEDASPGVQLLNGGFARWALGQIDSGETRVVTMTASVPITMVAGSYLIVTGQVVGETVETTAGDNGTINVVQVVAADLATTIALSPAEPQAGDTLTVTVTVANLSQAPAEGVQAHVGWPPELTFVTDTLSAGPVGATRILTSDGEVWQLGTVAPATTITITLVLQLVGAPPVGATLTVAAACTSTTVDPALGNSSAARTVIVVAPDLWVTKLAPRLAAPGEVVDYAVFYGNSGEAPGRGARLTDTLPTGVTFISATLPSTLINGSAVFELGTIPPAAGELVHVFARMDPALAMGLTVTNQAEIGAGPFDASPGNNASSAGTSLAPGVAATMSIAAPAVLATGGFTATVSATVRDAYGNRVSDGTAVRLTTSLGAFLPTSTTVANLLTLGGEVSATLASSPEAGTAHLVGAAGQATSTASVRFPAGPPSQLALRTEAVTPTVGTTATIIAEARDANGNLVEDGLILDIAASAGAVIPARIATSAGTARAYWTNNLAGAALLTATLGGLSQTRSVAFLAGPPDRLSLTVSEVNLPVVDGIADLSARVLDRFENGVSDGVMVSFGSPGGRFSRASAPTAGGVATSTFRAGALPGVYALSAAVGPVSGQQLVELQPTNLQLGVELRNSRGRTIDTQTYPREVVTYSLGVRNTGMAAAHGTILGLALPKGFGDYAVITPTRGITGGLRLPAGLISQPGDGTATAWQLGDVASGEAFTLTLVGRMEETNPWTGFDTLFFQGALTTTTAEATPVDLARTSTAKVYAADLFLGMNLESTSAIRPGGWLSFNLGYGNNQPQTTVPGALISINLPPELHYDTWSPLPGSVLEPTPPFQPDSTDLIWAVSGALQNTQGLKLRLTIDANAAPASVMLITATISSPVYDIRPGNNVLEDSQVRLKGVNMVASIEAPQAAAAGDTVRLKVRAENATERDAAAGIVTRARLPADWLVVETSPEAIRDTSSDLRWLFASLQAGGGVDYEVVAQVPETATVGANYALDAETTSDGPESYAADNYTQHSLRIVPGLAASLVLGADADRLVACNGPTTTLRATLADRRGLKVADGTVVQWRSTAGTLALTQTATLDGLATNVLRAATSPGTANVTALTAGAGGQAVQAGAIISMTAGPPGVLELSASPQQVPWQGTSLVTVQVRDDCNRPVDDGWPIALGAERGTWEDATGSQTTIPAQGGRVTARLAVGDESGPLKVTVRHAALIAEVQLAVGPAPTATPTPTPTPLPPRWEVYAPLALKSVPAGRR